jgi:hypothetical protein
MTAEDDKTECDKEIEDENKTDCNKEIQDENKTEFDKEIEDEQNLEHSHFCACLNPGAGFPIPYAVVFLCAQWLS